MKLRLRYLLTVAALLVLAVGPAACGDDGDSGPQQGEVVSVGTSFSLDALTTGEIGEGELAITSLDVDLGDEVVTVAVPEGDQVRLADSFVEGELEGAQVVVEPIGEDGEGWRFVDLAG